MAAPAPKTINLDTQNEVKSLIVTASNASGRITINATGDFSSGNLEVGYKTTLGVFTIYTDAVTTAAGGYELAAGSNREVFGRATGGTPDIQVEVQNIS